MIFHETKLKGAYLIEVEKHEDERGYFGRFWCSKEMEAHGLNRTIRQCNVSFSRKKGTIRGMHYQVAPAPEAKFVSCIQGRVYDVMVDLRPGSPTFMDWVGVELSAEDDRMVYVPEQFAHGILTLEEDSKIIYPVTGFYTPGCERGIRYNDPALNIQWPIDVEVVSEKDSSFPDFNPKTADQ